MSDVKAFVAWACRVGGCSERQGQIIVMIYGEGYTQAAAAAAMGLSASEAGRYAREGVRRLQVSEWDEHELAQWDRVVEAAKSAHGEESLVEHARALLDAVRNSQDPTPRTVDFDSNGRKIGGRSPLVDLDDALTICRDLEAIRKTPATNRMLSHHNRAEGLPVGAARF